LRLRFVHETRTDMNGERVVVAAATVPRGAGDEATARAVRGAVQEATDFAWLSRGNTVLIKLASNSRNPYPATTDPAAVHAMVGLLRQRGAGRVIVADMAGVQSIRFGPDHRRGSTREILERNGLARAARDAGAEIHAFEEGGWDGFFPDVPTARTAWSGAIWLPAILHSVDHVVLMPRCSRHMLAASSLGHKCAVGWWRHDSRLEYHRDAATFSEKTAEASTVPTLVAKQRLIVTSATRVLATFGPDHGRVETPETGVVFASASLLGHDMVSLAWLLETRQAMPRRTREGVLSDPNRSETMVNIANRIVTMWLGGVRGACEMQRLRRYDLHDIWDDRVLRRAFEIAGGIPRVELTTADGALPPSLRARLEAGIHPSS
jgi:uncharacterized protein (DUF362 family)